MTSSGFITYFFSTTQGVIFEINFKSKKSCHIRNTLLDLLECQGGATEGPDLIY